MLYYQNFGLLERPDIDDEVRQDIILGELGNAAEEARERVILIPITDVHVVEGEIPPSHCKIIRDNEGHVLECVYYTEA